MGRFVTKSDVKVIRHKDWEEGEEVTIKRWTIREKDRLDSKIIEIAGIAGQIPEVVVKSVTIPYLKAGIASWVLFDEEGSRIPLNDHWIGELKEEDADFIAAEIRTFNEGRTTAEEQEFLRQLAGGGEDGGETAT